MSAPTRCGSCRAAPPEGARFCPECGEPLTGGVPAAESRRIVTAVFVDLVSSTVLAESLDPEALRRTMDQYYRACTTAVTERGGVVEKFIGDAVMAVFGAFVSHEDDALHAVQAACAVRDALAGVNAGLERDLGVRIDIHCGIASGEAVVARAAGGSARVVGDVVHTAARLQSHAQAHEILIGDETARLVGNWVGMEAMAPLRLKGKRELVAAWRVTGLLDDTGQEDRVPLVGREAELHRLVAELSSARRDRRCRLVTLTGPTGIGKSRLVREFLAAPSAASAVVLRATCQPYGAGLAHRPMAEAVRSLPGGWEEAAGVLDALHSSAGRAVTALAVALGIKEENGLPVSVDEIAWAFRCLLEALGRRTPVILVLEEFHWAEPTLLDMIGETADGVSDAEVLIVCVARPETGEAPDDPGEALGGALALRLDALTREQSAELVGRLADRSEVTAQEAVCSDDMLAWVVRECDGNPLFAELLLEALADNRSAVQGLPTTIRVLLTAWLDRLPTTDREVLERAASVGGSFTVDDVRALSADSSSLTADVLDSSVRRLLRSRAIQPAQPSGTYRFTRMLARDTLYEMTSKARRTTWHTVLADRIETGRTGSGAESDLAHHLESAFRLLTEVRPGDPGLPALTARASRALVAAGYQALHRRDLPAAVSLMERGRMLTPEGDPEHRVLAVRITDAYAALGRWDLARQAVDEAERRSGRDLPTRHTCGILRQTIALRSDPPADSADPAGPTDRPGPQDDLSWCRLHQLSSLRSFAEGRIGAAESAMREALARARELGDAYEENRLLTSICELTQWSPTPLTQAIALCEDLARRFDTDRSLLVPILLTRARHLALSGRLDEARDDVERARRYATDLALVLGDVAADQTAALIESLSGAHQAAARYYTAAADRLGDLGQTTTAATLRVYAAREWFRARDDRFAAALGETAEAALETRAQAVRHALLAQVSARTGAFEDAVAAVDRAAAALDGTDDPCLIGDVWFEAARVLRAAGAAARARVAAQRALASLLAKEAVLPAEAVRVWLTEWDEPTDLTDPTDRGEHL